MKPLEKQKFRIRPTQIVGEIVGFLPNGQLGQIDDSYLIEFDGARIKITEPNFNLIFEFITEEEYELLKTPAPEPLAPPLEVQDPPNIEEPVHVEEIPVEKAVEVSIEPAPQPTNSKKKIKERGCLIG